MGDFGVGTFSQSGGTNSIANSLYLGYNSGSNATYSLGATGQLSAAGEYVGYVAGATGLFQQAGGTNSTNFLSIGSGGRYQLSGGTLQIQHRRTGQSRRLRRGRRHRHAHRRRGHRGPLADNVAKRRLPDG